MVVQLSIIVGNVTDLIGLGYTTIEIHQSIDEGNSFQEVTDTVARPAMLDSAPALTTFQVGGSMLKLKVDGGAEQSIVFSTIIENWTPIQVAGRINEVFPGLASVVSGNKVRLTSSTVGRTSSVEVTYNDSLSLGFVSGDIEYGKAARIPLISGTLVYAFPDQAGSADDRYKWRYSANGVNPISDFSLSVTGQTAPVISPSSMSIGIARFYGVDGRPVKTRLLVVPETPPQSIGGLFIGNDQTLIFDSEEDGYLQMPLVRNSRVRVGIEGTTYIREFVVPDLPSFDLLSVMATAPDSFTIQTTPPLLTRRSM